MILKLENIQGNALRELEFARAVKYCRDNGISTLEIENGKYGFRGDLCGESVCCIANHGSNGIKKAAFILDGMENFTLDAKNSELVMQGIICGFILKNCKNVTIKNFSIDSEVKFAASGKVIGVGDGYFLLKLNNPEPYFIYEGRMFFGEQKGAHSRVTSIIECNEEEKRFRADAEDCWFEGGYSPAFERLGDGTLKITGFVREPYPGNTMILMSGYGARLAPAIFAENCVNLSIENFTVYDCMGMGVIAQKCENVSVDNMKTSCRNHLGFSASADATHFVSCRGSVSVRNSAFEGQLDDAMNVHGIYNQIVAKGNDYIIIRYMHPETKGIDIYEPGAVIEISDRQTLIPFAEARVKDVKRINCDCTVLYIDGKTDEIWVGNVTEDITRCPQVIFENNSVSFNRARGILLASRARTVISCNYFNTPGSAILFESSGTKWYESGSTRDVVIENNIFDDCCYTEWGDAVIKVCEKPTAKYYHGKIAVKDNIFKNCNCEPVEVHNTRNFVYENNKAERD